MWPQVELYVYLMFFFFLSRHFILDFKSSFYVVVLWKLKLESDTGDLV